MKQSVILLLGLSSTLATGTSFVTSSKDVIHGDQKNHYNYVEKDTVDPVIKTTHEG